MRPQPTKTATLKDQRAYGKSLTQKLPAVFGQALASRAGKSAYRLGAFQQQGLEGRSLEGQQGLEGHSLARSLEGQQAVAFPPEEIRTVAAVLKLRLLLHALFLSFTALRKVRPHSSTSIRPSADTSQSPWHC